MNYESKMNSISSKIGRKFKVKLSGEVVEIKEGKEVEL